MDSAYNSHSYDGNFEYFTLKDSSGKEWRIHKTYFLKILNELTNQEYRIGDAWESDCLIRSITKKEKAEFENYRKNAKTEAVKLYFEKISANGEIFAGREHVRFRIRLNDGKFSYGNFYLEDSNGEGWKISSKEFLEILKKLTNQEYDISDGYLFRSLTKEEEAEYKR